MKRLVLLAGLVLGAALPARAWFWEQAPEKTQTIRYRLAVSADVSTAAVVIDLSDTSNWKHTDTGQVNISSLRVDIDKAAASTTTVKLGVVNFVNASTGSVTWFYGTEDTLNVSNTNIRDSINYTPTFLRAKALANESSPGFNNGSTPYLLSNDATSGSTVYQNDTNLPRAAGNPSPPARGDIVLGVWNGPAAIIVNVEIQYHTEK